MKSTSDMAINFMSSTRFYGWSARCLLCCFASFVLVASAQTQSPGQNPNPNAPVVISPDTPAQPQPSVQTQPSPEAWDHPWKIQKVSDDDDWTRHFRIGAMVGLNISANFSTKGTFNLPGNNAANGIYDNGYVRVDNTGNAGGYTSYWGYDKKSQFDSVNHTLTLDSTTSFSPTSGTSTKESGSAFAGFDMAYGGNLFYLGRARIGWDLGFGLLPISITGNQIMNANVKQSIYTFDATSAGVQMQNGGYQGGPDGGPWIVSNPLSVATNQPVAGGETVNGSYTMDVMLYTVRLGPSIYWDLNEDFGLSAGVGPAVGIMSGNLKYDEMIGTVRNKGQIDGTDVVYGGYVNASLMYHVQEHGDLYLGVQYMSLGNATISGGGRQGQLNLGGQVYISAGINWPF